MLVLTRFDSVQDCYHALRQEYAEVEGLSGKALESLCDKDLTESEKILHSCVERKVHILTFDDPRYPENLKNIPDPPIVLYYRGILPNFQGVPVIGVVGTRKASTYGLSTARRIGRELAQQGAIVVSGMAEGIDAMATWGVLDAECPVVGVLGNGADIVYPRCNLELFRRVERQGCLISEYPPGTKPAQWTFPRRNRIISGLSCGVLVVEAPVRSGALITARQALEQGRDVFVVPGNVGNDSCEGSNALLRDYGYAVSNGWDILSEYIYRYPGTISKAERLRKNPAQAAAECVPKGVPDKKAVDNPTMQPYSDVDIKSAQPQGTEQAILSVLRGGEQQIDTVIAKTGLPSGEVLSALTLLEVEGAVITRPGGWVSAL